MVDLRHCVCDVDSEIGIDSVILWRESRSDYWVYDGWAVKRRQEYLVTEPTLQCSQDEEQCAPPAVCQMEVGTAQEPNCILITD